MKECVKCTTKKPFSEFYGRGDKKGRGLQSQCKACVRASRKLYVANNRDKIKSLELKRSFGIDITVFNEMFAAQGGCCGICGRHSTELKKTLHVDHDHKTGKVRALLCQGCNQGIGNFLENSESLLNAIQYLKKHNSESADKITDVAFRENG